MKSNLKEKLSELGASLGKEKNEWFDNPFDRPSLSGKGQSSILLFCA